MRLEFKVIVNYIMVLTMFLGSFVLLRGAFDFYLFYIIFFVFLVIAFLNRVEIINTTFFVLFSVVFFLSIINSSFSGFSVLLVLKQLGILFSASAYYLLIKINDYDVDYLFRIYLNVVFFVCLLGLIQEFSFLIKFRYGYDWSFFIPGKRVIYGLSGLVRIDSIMQEPSVLSIILSPAMFVALNNILTRSSIYMNFFRSIIILSTFVLTFSSTGYMGLFFALILILYRNRFFSLKNKRIFYLPIALILISILASNFYSKIPDFKNRVDGVTSLLQSSNMLVDASVFIWYANFGVTIESLKNTPLFGTGLGTYPEAFDKYVEQFIGPEIFKNNRDFLVHGWGLFVSKNDANSMFLRLLTETGLFGVIILLYFLIKFFIFPKNSSKKTDNNFDYYNRMSIINNGIFVLILLRLIRYGNYFVDGMFFFIFLYYFSGKIYKETKRHDSLGDKILCSDALQS